MKVIRFMGDSTTYGSTTFPGTGYIQAPDNPPAEALRLLKKQFGESAVQVYNDAIPGSSIVDWWAGAPTSATNPGMPSFTNRMNMADYLYMDIGVFEIGINDAAPTPPKQQTTVNDFEWYLCRIYEQFVAHGKTLVLSTPSPITHPNYPALDALQAKVKSFAAARGILLIDHYAMINSIPNWRDLLVDPAHLRNVLYALKGAHAAARLHTLIN